MILKEMLCTIKLYHVVVLLCLLTISEFIKCNDEPRVKTKYGTFIGTVMKSRNGRDILSFLGIPFAQPPIGKLRYMESKALDESDDVVYANKIGNDCFQENYLAEIMPDKMGVNNSYRGNEDCLYLNIYVPKLEKENNKLPVLVLIHGGGYFIGSGTSEFNGPELLLDRNLIMVTLNYRLSVLGFLSASDDIPENLGMKDQTFAMKWVKENIGNFGGDPNSITLAGLSAGASSVTLHHHSKLSRGLFHRGIAASGSLYSPWALRSRQDAREIASKIINYLGCSTKSNQLLICLQEMPATELFNAVKDLKKYKLGVIMHLGPVIERDSPSAFITEKSINESSKIPLMTGVTNEEGLGFYQLVLAEDPSFADLSPMKTNAETLLPIMTYYSASPNKDAVTSELVKYYMDSEWIKDKIPNFVQMLSDTLFNHGLHALSKNYKGKLYEYLWSYISSESYNPFHIPLPGLENAVCHGEDGRFVITSFMFTANMTDDDIKCSNFVLDLWSNFMTYGDPTPESRLWKESNYGMNYLEFRNDGHSMKTHMFKERMNFLDTLNFDKIPIVHDEL